MSPNVTVASGSAVPKITVKGVSRGAAAIAADPPETIALTVSGGADITVVKVPTAPKITPELANRETTLITLAASQGPPGTPGRDGIDGGLDSASFIFGEAPTGLINGVNATFQSQYDFIPESVSVFLNGMRLKIVEDYQTSGTRTISLNVSPTVGEMIQIDYLRG